APSGCRLVIFVLGCHLAGWRYALRHVVAEAARKGVEVVCRAALRIDNRRAPESRMELLWPSSAGNDNCVREYVASLKPRQPGPPLFRDPALPRREVFFSSCQARETIEQAFLSAGAYLALAAPHQRHLPPLGYEVLETL